jgi:hypothetical protein
MQTPRQIRTGKAAARTRSQARVARIVICAIFLPCIGFVFWAGTTLGSPVMMLGGVALLGGLWLLLRLPMPEGRPDVPMLTLCAKGIQIEPAALRGRKGPILFPWSEIDQIVIVWPIRGRPRLRIVPTPAAAVAQGLRPASWVPTALSRWTIPAVAIPTDLFDGPESLLIEGIGAAARDYGIATRMTNRLDGGWQLVLAQGPGSSPGCDSSAVGAGIANGAGAAV